MKKLVLVLLILFACNIHSYALDFNFNSMGEEASNIVLEEFILENFDEFRGDVISFQNDIDNDGINEIIGIVKFGLFYNKDGYKLVILKLKDDNWYNIDTDIYFDISKPLIINKNKVTYYKSSVQSKQFEAKVPSKLTCGFDEAALRKNIKNAYFVTTGTSGREIDISSYKNPEVQKTVKIHYKNLSDRTKHYLEMK